MSRPIPKNIIESSILKWSQVLNKSTLCWARTATPLVGPRMVSQDPRFRSFVTSALAKNLRIFWHCLLNDDELLDEHIDEKLFQGPYYCAVGAGNVSCQGFENRTI